MFTMQLTSHPNLTSSPLSNLIDHIFQRKQQHKFPENNFWFCPSSDGSSSSDDEGFFVSADFKVLGRECGAGRGPTNDDEEFFISSDFKCFRKGVWGGRGPTNNDEGFFVSADFNVLIRSRESSYFGWWAP